MKTHPLSLRVPFRLLAALLVTVALLFAAGASAQSTNWLTGVNVFSNAVYGALADSDVVDNATLIITNGGALTAGQLNVGPTNLATLTLDIDGALTVNALLATNVVLGGVTNSVFNFKRGTLITSNNNGIAANIIQASNVAYSVRGNWTMNAGTNFVVNVATNFVSPTVYFGNGDTNLVFNVNSNAVLSLANPAIRSTNQTLQIANGSSTNNVFTVNGGVVNNVNQFEIGNAGSSVSNQLVITNGGQFTLGNSVSSSHLNGSYNSVFVAGTNGAGRRATLDLGGSGDRRLYVGNNTISNLLQVAAGGVFTNGGVQMTGGFGNATIVTNGGQVYFCLLYTSPSPRDGLLSRMPSSA